MEFKINPTGDALSDVLRMVQLKACVYFVRDMPAPWGMELPASATGPLHMVLHGHCVFRFGDTDIELNEGDAILLPRGDSHQMLDSVTTTPVPVASVMPQLYADPNPEISGKFTRMLCGHFEWNSEIDHPLFRELPEYLVVRNFGNRDADQFKSIVSLIAAQCAENELGDSVIADRLGEVLFITLLKSWMIENAAEQGILAALHDTRLARALRHIHRNAEQQIDLNVLARVAGMSRTAFAVSFKAVMGITPAAYLAEWRLLKARRLLLNSSLPLAQIPDHVGYATEGSFARAYKRRFAESPASTRRWHKHSAVHSEQRRSSHAVTSL